MKLIKKILIASLLLCLCACNSNTKESANIEYLLQDYDVVKSDGTHPSLMSDDGPSKEEVKATFTPEAGQVKFYYYGDTYVGLTSSCKEVTKDGTSMTQCSVEFTPKPELSWIANVDRYDCALITHTENYEILVISLSYNFYGGEQQYHSFTFTKK